MSTLVFQATLGGQVNMVGPNTASTFTVSIPAITGTMITTGDTGTVTNTMLASNVYTAPGTIGSGTPNTGAFTTLSASSTTTLSGGTANGIAYLNGSKVVTTGSALTFDGTNLGITGSGSRVNWSSVGTGGGLFMDYGTGAADFALTFSASPFVQYDTPGGWPHVWAISSTEQMRLTSSLLTVTPGATIQGLTVGRGAGAVSSNTAVGASALASNTTGAFNTSVGNQALANNLTGSQNTAIGRLSLNQATADYNTAVGQAAGYSTTTGQVDAFGRLALYNNTTGASNVGIGQQALFSNTTASNNTAVGYQAGYSGTTAAANTILGKTAGYSLTTSGYNVLLGVDAGYNLTTGATAWNTFVGTTAGRSTTTGTGNTFVGGSSSRQTGSGYYVTTGSANTILGGYDGNQGGLDIRTASNYVVLSDGDGNPRGIFDSAGAFLLNATAKVSGTTYLSVQGSTAGSNIIEQKDTGTSYAAGNYYQVYFNSSNAVAGGIAHTTATTVSFNVSSDARLKEQIVDAPPVLQKVLNTKVRSYVWKEDKHAVEYGLIAQELYEQLPEAVGKGSDSPELTDYKGTWQVEYGRLTPMLIKAIQEQQALIESLTTRLAALEAA